MVKNRIGIVLDEGCFYDELTLSEMKNVIASAYKNWCEKDFIDYLERFSLNPKQKINTLSKGMRMKYALALALSHKAERLIMDEPTSGLDPLIRSQLLNILKNYMSKGGKGVFFSIHITSDLEKIADMLINTALCIALSPQNDCTFKILFLFDYLYGMLFDFWD